MAFYLDLFTPETWDAFMTRGASISGFREKQGKSAERVKLGDIFLCYVVRLSRWCGVLEVASPLFVDSTPYFTKPDPFVIRFKVKPIVALNLDRSIPILDEAVWSKLSLTKNIERGAPSWAQIANLRASLRQIAAPDGQFLRDILVEQGSKQQVYAFSAQDKQRMGIKRSINTIEGAVLVDVPSDEPRNDEGTSATTVTESHKVQATIARIGADMGFHIWVPKVDKQRILGELHKDSHPAFLDALPLNYDDTTLRTIEQIGLHPVLLTPT